MTKTKTFVPNPRSFLPALGHIALRALTQKYGMTADGIKARIAVECARLSFADRVRKVREYLDAYQTITTLAAAQDQSSDRSGDLVMKEACIFACTLTADYVSGNIPQYLKESVLFNADYVGEMSDLAAAPFAAIAPLLLRCFSDNDRSGK